MNHFLGKNNREIKCRLNVKKSENIASGLEVVKPILKISFGNFFHFLKSYKNKLRKKKCVYLTLKNSLEYLWNGGIKIIKLLNFR
jgi:hypothetical protein